MAEGILITFEGIDGCGKTTQAGLLQDALGKVGLPHILVREPGGTAVGEMIRELLLQKEYNLTLKAELLLYAAARAEVVQQVIRPALNKGKIVVCDRYTDSTLAYQGYGAGADLLWVRSLNKWVTDGLQPRQTFLLDLPLELALQRRDGIGDRIEERARSFHQNVRKGYLTLAKQEQERFSIIDAGTPPEEQHRYILEQCKSMLY